MTIVEVPPAELRLRVDPAALGFADTSELLELPLPWIGQERAERAARFGLRMDQPDYNLFVLGEVGSGRTSLMSQMMASEAAHAAGAARPLLPAQLRGAGAPARAAPAGRRGAPAAPVDGANSPRRCRPRFRSGWWHRTCRPKSDRIENAYKAEEDRAYAELSAFAEARNFGLMREQGRMVFTQRDEKGEPLTAGKALTLTREQRAALDAAEDALRAEISRFLETTRATERVMNETLAALRRRMVKPLLIDALQDIRNELRKQIKDSVKLGLYFDQVQHDVLENLELFQPGDEDDEAARRRRCSSCCRGCASTWWSTTTAAKARR